MVRLTFQNVPTPSGGVASGNISIGAGSPFGAGGKYESKVAGIQAEIAKKPKGYYDPVEGFGKQSKTVEELLAKNLQHFESDRIFNLNKAMGDARAEKTKQELFVRLTAERNKERDEQLQLHTDAIIARINNGEIIAPDYFQNNIILLQTGGITNEQFLRTFKIYYDNGTIHQLIVVEKPIPAPTTPTPTTPTPSTPTPSTPTPSTPTPSTPTPSTPTPSTPVSTISILPIILGAVALIGILLFLRRRV